MLKIADVTLDELATRLRNEGIGLRFGPYTFRIQSELPLIAQAVHVLHGDHPLVPPYEFSDFRMRLDPRFERGRRMVVATVNGHIWQAWPRRLTVAGMEWVCSWCFFRASHRHLAIHGASALIPGSENQTLVFPGNSGAGKSTLASTLMMCGWGLLSDEISMFDLDDLTLTALGRPTILKGHSLELISERYGSDAVFGPYGRIVDPPVQIAHLRSTAKSHALRGKSFSPAAIVFPRRGPGQRLELKPVTPGGLFTRLNQFGINYRQLGESGFQATVRLAKHVPAFELFYDEAADAERFLRDHDWNEVAIAATERSDPKRSVHESPGRNRPCASTAALSAADPVSVCTKVSAAPPRGVAANADIWNEDLTQMIDLLRGRVPLESVSLPQWDALTLVASHTGLLSRVAWRARESAAWEWIPAPARSRLEHEIQSTRFNDITFGFELRQLKTALAAVDDPVVLLKGVAYLAAAMPWAGGRRTNDVDLLVSEAALPRVEAALRRVGYAVDDDLSEADCRYYRRWLHELAPLKHAYRRIEVDVHFRLLPISDPRSFVADELIARSIRLPDSPFSILDRVDRVLHSALNLARTGEFQRAFRDLWDISCMIEQPCDLAGAQSGERSDTAPFDWQELIRRTCELQLGMPVACMLSLAMELLQLDCPAEVIEQMSGGSVQRLRRQWIYRTMRVAAIPAGPDFRSRKRCFALWSLEHYPLPKMRTWLDPLTWTKRIAFTKDD
ncbi:hypothetical protein Pla52o_42360 [Novipirellula galeiformis]|uniref:Uncharacterized protein n=1 Tax=Novipirellula galeiformis TaxID=2528004 RepID=A0A5C6CAT5_9BACT|nr:nucleotidyltransferase family protein [Novipirellula galeiformis]TWU21202.1 hypothetical protein Pla52o_42360 [Novipirellula galeiformis]